MTVSLPEARSVDHVSKEVRFSHPRRAYPVVGIGLFSFSGGLKESGIGSIPSSDFNQCTLA